MSWFISGLYNVSQRYWTSTVNHENKQSENFALITAVSIKTNDLTSLSIFLSVSDEKKWQSEQTPFFQLREDGG